MDFLFLQLMLWGKQEGYRWFNLGMAPLSGMAEQGMALPRILAGIGILVSRGIKGVVGK